MRYHAFAQVMAGAAVAVAASTVATGQPVPPVESVVNARTGPATPAGVTATFRYAFVGEGDVIQAADAVVRGTVVAVSAPRWNQESGERWSMDTERPTSVAHPPAAFMLQTVELTVAEVWRGSGIGAGDMVAFVVPGNGIGEAWDREGAFLTPGTDVVVLLDRRHLGWRDGPDGRKEMLTLSGAYQGVYRVGPDGGLVNASRERLDTAGDQRSSRAGDDAGTDARATTVADLRARVALAVAGDG